MSRTLDFLRNCRKISPRIQILLPSEAQRYLENLSDGHRIIEGALVPNEASEVMEIVKLANEFTIPLYPISHGRNWGFGSRLPVRDGAVVVDLSSLNTIRRYNPENGTVQIEPGVTQWQLAEFLQARSSEYFLDVTGSSAQSSILGNALERGIAYNSLRSDSVVNIEVVLGSGRVLKTGFLHYGNATCADRYRSGIGPDLSGLMFQSNFGIVTALTYRLTRKSPIELSFSLSFPDRELPEVIDRVREIKKRLRWESIVHIGNRKRASFSAEPYGRWLARSHPEWGVQESEVPALLRRELLREEWTAIGGIHGSKATVSELKGEIRKSLGKLGGLRILSRAQFRFARNLLAVPAFARFKKLRFLLETVAPFHGLSHGAPSNASIQSFFKSNEVAIADRVDFSETGFFYCVPLAPLHGSDAKELNQIIRDTSQSFGFEPEITLNTIQQDLLEAVVSVSYSRNNVEEAERAQRCNQAMHQALIQKGFHPYRLGIDLMHLMVTSEDDFWKTAFELKKALDPKLIISPGRYNLG